MDRNIDFREIAGLDYQFLVQAGQIKWLAGISSLISGESQAKSAGIKRGEKV